MRRVLFLLVTLISMPLAAAPLARVAGQVTIDGQSLPGCIVQLKSAAMTRTVVSDANGRYAFPGVVQGEYEIHFELEGMEPSQRRVLVQGESVAVPVVDLQLAAAVESITIVTCGGAVCAEDPPLNRFGLPLCSDRWMNTALIESVDQGDASWIEPLRKRYETADTYQERHRIAAALLRRTPDDAKYWNELVSHAEIAVLFPHEDDELSPEYFQWCAERGIAPEQHWSMAYRALEIVAAGPRSRSLLLQALATDDSLLVAAAITGLGKQKDFDSLPLIEHAIGRMHDPGMLAIYLAHFADERADAVAEKYRGQFDSDVYRQWRSAAKQAAGDPH